LQIEAMQKELAEKGIGLEDLANAHGQWQDDEDKAELKRLKRCLKYGFTKSRRRMAQVWQAEQHTSCSSACNPTMYAVHQHAPRQDALPGCDMQPTAVKQLNDLVCRVART
jgi:hypothetical protein